MIHLGRQHPLADHQQGHLGGALVQHLPRPGLGAPEGDGARNFTQCDSLLIGKQAAAHTVPVHRGPRTARPSSSTRPPPRACREDQLFYAMQRGLSQEEAVQLLVNGFVKDVLQELPMEFAVEAQKLVAISLEGSVG
jgi:Fe-S cluster assembly protein SufB